MTPPSFRQTCALACVLALGAAACGDDDDDAPRASGRGRERDDAGGGSRAGDAGEREQQVLAGVVADSDAWLGAIVAGERARIFFCGGPSSYATATAWLRTELDDAGRFAFADDVVDVKGQLDDTGLHGELTVRDEPATRFSAQPVRASTLAGLYEAEGDCGRIGVIIRPRTTGSGFNAQGACVGTGHAPEQVNPILPLATSDDGSIAVEVEREDGSLEPARVRRAAL